MPNYLPPLVGQSPEFNQVIHAARLVAATNAPVLLCGERGSGREALARQIHKLSPLSSGNIKLVNCAGLEMGELKDLLSESHGTLLLKEVAELSADDQVSLLRFMELLESGQHGQVLRLMAVTSEDLYALVSTGDFREDLYYRLNVVPLMLPALRERSEDIITLLKLMTADLARSHGRKAPRYSVSSRNILKAYLWPGNLLELKNFCERMVILNSGAIIQPEQLPMEMRQEGQPAGGEFGFKLPVGGVDLLALEGEVIRQALGMSGGNRSKAARLLGLTRDTLLYRLRKHCIES
ncbi:MAG: sigma-54-dependent Fis family transcriptional regulator [Gammaproteobacteria bacterium]|nr:sigma-54-dependent Fis family transcriptional regulator [Gammaproteobacteria bacterium]